MGEKTLHRQSFGLAQGLRFIEPLATLTSSHFQSSAAYPLLSPYSADNLQAVSRVPHSAKRPLSVPEEYSHSPPYPHRNPFSAPHPCRTPESEPAGKPKSPPAKARIPELPHTPTPSSRTLTCCRSQKRTEGFSVNPSCHLIFS